MDAKEGVGVEVFSFFGRCRGADCFDFRKDGYGATLEDTERDIRARTLGKKG